MHKVTIKDVARLAGVSVSTVSLVLNKRGYVSDHTQQKIEQIMEEQGYYPRRSARHLASNRSGNYGFIVSDFHLSQNEFFYSRVLLGAELEARILDYYVLLTTVSNSYDPKVDSPRFLQSQDVDGVIVAGAVPDELIHHVLDLEIPLVMVDFKSPSVRTHMVLIENYEGVFQAVNHLLGSGRERIAFVGGSYYHQSVKDRYRGYRDALLEAGLNKIADDKSLSWLEKEETSSEIGYKGITQILDSGANPDSVICCNDTTAIGVLHALHQRGIETPGQVAVIGFDDIGYASYSRPPLTTLHVPKAEMGVQAVRILAEETGRNDQVRYQTRLVQADLVVRESTVLNSIPETDLV